METLLLTVYVLMWPVIVIGTSTGVHGPGLPSWRDHSS